MPGAKNLFRAGERRILHRSKGGKAAQAVGERQSFAAAPGEAGKRRPPEAVLPAGDSRHLSQRRISPSHLNYVAQGKLAWRLLTYCYAA